MRTSATSPLMGIRYGWETVGGIGRLDTEKNSWTAIRAKEKTDVLRHSHIQHTALDGDWIWFVTWMNTSNGSIVRFDKRTGSWTHYMNEDVKAIDAPPIDRIDWFDVAKDPRLVCYRERDFGIFQRR